MLFSTNTRQLARVLTLVMCGYASIVTMGCDRGVVDGTRQSDGGGERVPSRPSPEAIADEMQQKRITATNLHQTGQTAEALKIALEVLTVEPHDMVTLSMVMQLHSELGEHVQAAAVAERFAEVNPTERAQSLLLAFYWYMEAKRFGDAERVLWEAIEFDTTHLKPYELLASLLCAQGRRHEASDVVLRMIRLGPVRKDELLSLVDRSMPYLFVSFDEQDDKSRPSLFLLGEALHRFVVAGDPENSLRLTQTVSEHFPDNITAKALHGRILAESGRFGEYEAWLNVQDDAIESSAYYWSSLGLALQFQNQYRPAIRSYSEAFLRDPTSRSSLRGIVECLEAEGQTELALRIREKLSWLEQIFRTSKTANATECREISKLLQQLSRPWESTAWLMQAMQQEGTLAGSKSALMNRLAEISKWERENGQELIRVSRLESTLGFRRDDFPLVKRLSAANAQPVANTQPAKTNLDSAPSIEFQDVTDLAQLKPRTQVTVGADQTHIGFLYQTTGTGVGVLDFDNDGRCDLYVVHAFHQPLSMDDHSANQLFRNLDSLAAKSESHYVDVSKESLTDDGGYGQGVSVGDVNQDGFADILVANFGTNVIFMNQGDGTFHRVENTMFRQDSWTTSMALADLNGDHLPDIVEVNYVDDPEAPTKACPLGSSCTPQQLGPAEDVFYQCNPDGTYRRHVLQGGIAAAAYGMGSVVVDFDGQLGNEVFIANDAEFNHFWSRASDSTDASPRWVESATIRGCSVGRNGLSQACMGVAAGDFNRDGRIDLYVTNFINEPANLFLQTGAGTFADAALPYDLFSSSMQTLGFGTQARDWNNDGWLDLAVLNGHVFGDHDPTTPFRMRPQILTGSADRFDVVQPESIGNYFTQPALGRSLAALDWNRDGRMDFVASHLDRPFALLENRSMGTGNWIQFSLVGVTSERDAVGAQVTIITGEQKWHVWRTSGDGYLCSNEALLHVGLGESDPDQVIVRWPSGVVQSVNNLQPNQRYHWIEGETPEQVTSN